MDDPSTVREYFRRWYEGITPDSRRIQDLRRAFDFPEVARRFRLIADDTVDVVVAYGISEDELDALLARLRGSSSRRLMYRRLQPLIVSLRRWDYDEALRRDLVVPIVEGLGRWVGRYDELRGLVMEGFAPSDLVV